MDIKELGRVGFIERITSPFVEDSNIELRSFREDAAVIANGDRYTLLSVSSFMEGVHFNLTLNPLKHLGYKCVVATLSNILAMNAKPSGVMIAVAIPARFSVEHIEEFYSGVNVACKQCNVALLGGNTTASVNGLSISVTSYGEVSKESIAFRSGAKANNLICISGSLGAAYLGTKLLERERNILQGNNISMPQLDGYEYQLGKALKPSYRGDVIDLLAENKIVPTSMIDISDCLASEILHICKESSCGANIFLDKLPIASTSFTLAEELKSDAVLAAMNGGEDYELMFTVDISKYEEVLKLGFDVIGHITTQHHTAVLITPDGGEIAIQAPSWSVSQ